MKEARHYIKLEYDKVKCTLCPHECKISPGKWGNCNARKNIEGVLYSMNYGQVSAMNLDPVEKKPLYHFYPGRPIFSVGTYGCNFHCQFCQNCDISQMKPEEQKDAKEMLKPEQIVSLALKYSDNAGIAFTYNEPVVFYEYMLETAILAKEKGLKTAMVSNGFINIKPLEELLPFIDSFSIDIKGFTDDFYTEYTSATLQPVKDSLKIIKASGKHLELVNLVIPGLNDDPVYFEKMLNWIKTELGADTVFHISRYFPRYKMHLPATPIDTLRKLYRLAKEKLNFVYLGNVGNWEVNQDTYCPHCRNRLVMRNFYYTSVVGLTKNGCCIYCKYKVATLDMD